MIFNSNNLSTATVVTYFNNMLYIGNVGNSKCILVKRKQGPTPEQLGKLQTSAREKGGKAKGSVDMLSLRTDNTQSQNHLTTNRQLSSVTKDAIFLHKANKMITKGLYGDKEFFNPKIPLEMLKGVKVSILTTEHSVTDYDETTRIYNAGILSH